MSNFYSYPHHPSHLNSHASHNHHGGRSRRAPRIGGPHAKQQQQQHQQQQQQFRSPRNQKEIIEPVNMTSFRRDFEAARSFDIEDDEIFCPFNLLTDDDLQSIHSSGSDRSSLSSGSPESSPLQHQLQPSSTFTLPSTANPYTPMNYQPSQPKLHQPMAQRTRNAIPIVDPSTRAVASPPPSVSPARQMQQFVARRW